MLHLFTLPPNLSEPSPTSPTPHSCVPSFSAESELEKEQWLEAMQGAIAEALSTSEVAERIWAVAPNRFCADCGAAQPDWASINLCIVICKRCAGVWGWRARLRHDRAGVSVWLGAYLARAAGAKTLVRSLSMKLRLCTRPLPP